jgi:Tol biopolymer transport system component
VKGNCTHRWSDNCGVWAITAGVGNPGQLSTHPSDTAPSWSPDGSQVAFTSSRSGNWEIYLVDLQSGTERRLTDHGAADVAPAWAPDGRRLAFLSNREGKWGVYVLDVRSGQAQFVINAGDAYPEPVGERLTWVP